MFEIVIFIRQKNIHLLIEINHNLIIRPMIKYCILFVLLFYLIQTKAQPVKIMLVTGGHAYDTIQFIDMFDALKGVEYEHFQQPKANREIANNKVDDFDVLVFYDMWKSITEAEKSAYLKLTMQGKPFLFLHHSIASYQNWPEFEKLLGGKYVEAARGISIDEQSNYQHDVWVYCSIENITPVTKGFKELRFFDEIYGNVKISDDILPLLKTRYPKSMETVAWENHYNNSKIIYIQPGHDYRTYGDENYRKLLTQAIHYLAGRNQ